MIIKRLITVQMGGSATCCVLTKFRALRWRTLPLHSKTKSLFRRFVNAVASLHIINGIKSKKKTKKSTIFFKKSSMRLQFRLLHSLFLKKRKALHGHLGAMASAKSSTNPSSFKKPQSPLTSSGKIVILPGSRLSSEK